MWHLLREPPVIDAAGRILVPLPAAPFAGPATLRHAGVGFTVKAEHHVTLAGAQAGARLIAAAGGLESLRAIATSLSRTHLRAWRLLPDGWHLRRPAGADLRHPQAADALNSGADMRYT